MSEQISAPDREVVVLLTQRWRLLALLGAIGLAVGVIYALLAPTWYQGRITLVPSQRSQSSAPGLSELTGLAALAPSMLSDGPRIQAVLTSQSVTDGVIAKFGLTERYGARYIEHTRAQVWKHCETSVEPKSSVITLTCEDRDPTFAQKMVAYFGELGNQVFGRISVSSAREERRFLEAQVVKARQAVDDASRKLRAFQEEHRLVDLGEQSKAVISALAKLQGEVVSKQIELSYVSGFSSKSESGVVQLKEQLAILEDKIEQLEAVRVPAPEESARDGSSFFPAAMAVPELRFELEQLFREQKIHETVFLLLTQRLEMAKVDEARDTSTFQILDPPTVPTYRSRPNRSLIAAAGLAAGLAAGGAWILLPGWWRRRTIAIKRDEG